MSFHYNFDKLDLLIYKNRPYRWLDQTEQGFRFASDDELEQVITIRHEEMQGLLDNPDARVERGHFGRSRATMRRNANTEFLADLLPKKRFKALWDCELGHFGQSLIRSGQMTLSDASIEAARPAFVAHMATWAEQQRLDEKVRDKTRNVDVRPKDRATTGWLPTSRWRAASLAVSRSSFTTSSLISSRPSLPVTTVPPAIAP